MRCTKGSASQSKAFSDDDGRMVLNCTVVRKIHVKFWRTSGLISGQIYPKVWTWARIYQVLSSKDFLKLEGIMTDFQLHCVLLKNVWLNNKEKLNLHVKYFIGECVVKNEFFEKMRAKHRQCCVHAKIV